MRFCGARIYEPGQSPLLTTIVVSDMQQSLGSYFHKNSCTVMHAFT